MPTSQKAQRRKTTRQKCDAQVIRLELKDRMGNPKWVTADLLDMSEGGVKISLLTPLAIGSLIVIRGKLGGNRNEDVNSATVRWCMARVDGGFHAGLEFDERDSFSAAASSSPGASADEMDCYEVMQLSPNADADTVQRVYRLLAQRFHPDSPETGDKETFLRLSEAHRILSNPEERARYDARYRATKQLHWQIFDHAEAASGPQAERRKRLGILELLYAKTLHDPERATMSVLEFEDLLGCPREHLGAALWYLRGKDYVKRGDNGRFMITIAGVDEVERHAMGHERRNRKLLEPAGGDRRG